MVVVLFSSSQVNCPLPLWAWGAHRVHGALCKCDRQWHSQSEREKERAPAQCLPVLAIVSFSALANCCGSRISLPFGHSLPFFWVTTTWWFAQRVLSISRPVAVHYQCKLPFFASLHTALFAAAASAHHTANSEAAAAIFVAAVSSSLRLVHQLQGKIWFSVCFAFSNRVRPNRLARKERAKT